MYFVIRNEIDPSGKYISSEIVNHVSLSSSDSDGTDILMESIKSFVSVLSGSEEADSLKIINIDSLDTVSEPLIDSVIAYRINSDPNNIHIYRRKTHIIQGRLYGQTVVPEFKKIKIFSLVKYDLDNHKTNIMTSNPIPMKKSTSPPPPPPHPSIKKKDNDTINCSESIGKETQYQEIISIQFVQSVQSEQINQIASDSTANISPSQSTDLITELKSSSLYRKRCLIMGTDETINETEVETEVEVETKSVAEENSN